ncbi:anti-sigma factor [Nocardioides sp. GY 10127]|uniref:anti-sigma factor n=1 Tax=Nocardioides sp. GY 10127 TaxID=2569762 RepID=UPI0010A7C42A|nr:anti-sigma factor [Nocardioides sp. GY 10127]TIC82877.1 anti-sigma factor [Nocardioides sp. GY 10127]
MSDVHALSGAYAIDALDELERARFEQHLAECGTCRTEVDSLREAGALLAELEPLTPPAGLRDRVLAEAATVRPLPPVERPADAGMPVGPGSASPVEQDAVLPTPLHGRTARTRSGRRWPTFVAAAAAVAVLGALGGVAVTQPWSQDSTTVTAGESRVAAVLGADDAETYTQQLDGGASVSVVRSVALGEAVVVTQGMPAAPDGSVYELWLNQDSGMVAAGFMPDGSDNEVLLSGDAATASGVGISVEPQGGSPEPTLDGAVVIPFEAA